MRLLVWRVVLSVLFTSQGDRELIVNVTILSLPNGRGSWVVGTSRGCTWVKVMGVGND